MAAPGPPTVDRVYYGSFDYQPFKGPSGSRLHWTIVGEWPTTMLRDQDRLTAPPLLRIGPLSCAHAVAPDRLLVWRQLWTPPSQAILRISLFDTKELRSIGWLPKIRSGDPVFHASGLVAEVDLPGPWVGGPTRASFPEPLRGIPEILLLVRFIEDWSPELARAERKRKRTTAICIAKPPLSEVDVLPLDWARSVEGRIHWIARVARDPATGRIVGDGVGFGPFLLDERGRFLGWIRPAD